MTCAAGSYFDSRADECRNCEYVCGDEYGGREQLECTENCPGYGLSTTVAPANDSGYNIVLISLSVSLALVLICVVIVFCRIKKKCSWGSARKSIVREETKEGLVGPSALSA